MEGRWRGRLGGLRGGRSGGRVCGSSDGEGLVRARKGHWGQSLLRKRRGNGYYSVGLLEEFIAGGGAGKRVPVAVGIMSFKELVERGGYVAHLP